MCNAACESARAEDALAQGKDLIFYAVYTGGICLLLCVLLFLKNQLTLSKPKENPRPVPVWACVSGLWVLVAFLIYWTISHEAWWDGMEEPGEIDVDASLDDFGPTPCTSLKSILTSFQLCGTGLTMFRTR
jgi:hypothetical protein